MRYSPPLAPPKACDVGMPFVPFSSSSTTQTPPPSLAGGRRWPPCVGAAARGSSAPTLTIRDFAPVICDSKWWLYATLIGTGTHSPLAASHRTWSHSKPITAIVLLAKRRTISGGSGTGGSCVQNTSE